jgi:long-chain acyl-CoA synthetase
MAPQLPTLKVLVSLDTLPTEEKKILVAWGQSVGIQVMDLAEGNLVVYYE